MTATDSRTRNRLLIVLFTGVLMGALDIAIVGRPCRPSRRALALATGRWPGFSPFTCWRT